ncbi:serine hydrolase domain-containing protein [Henriciella aquimarina]|uniref:serine hydrolase domain-containing protein n=1 Tax=Henriciella aquimarina TaxID=545261 RepID=UPI000A05C804|nr:serine hydrolase domain-containing protein [Henriciella aquimarina]
MELAKDASFEEISGWLDGVRKRWGQPGVGLGLVCEGEVAFTTGQGVREAGQAAPVDEATLFALASLSKSFVSAGVGRLVHEGLLDWDDRVQAHLPWFRLSDPWVSEHVTVRDLMCNRLGLLPSEGRHRRVARDRYDLLRRMRYQPFRHDFRAQYGYCTDGFTIAGELVEAVTGQSWEAYTRHAFWDPLGMSDTNADHLASRAAPNSCRPHRMISGSAQPIVWDYEGHVATPAGGVNSSIRDISKWLAGNAAGGTWQGMPVFPADVFAEITQAHTPERGAFAENELSCVVGRGPDGIEDQAYGLGWYVHRYRSRKVICHSGRIDGFCGFVMICPNERFGVIVLANADNVCFPRAVAQALVDWGLGLTPTDWDGRFHAHQKKLNADRQQADEARFGAAGVCPSVEAFAACCGDYADRTGFGEAALSLKAGALQLSIGAETFELTPRDAETLVATPARQDARPQFLVHLERDGHGGVCRFTTDQGAVFERAPDKQGDQVA